MARPRRRASRCAFYLTFISVAGSSRCSPVTCGFVLVRRGFCALGGAVAVGWAGAVCADGEDVVGRHGGEIGHSYHRGSRQIEHIGSAHDDVDLELLKAAARQRLAAGQGELDLGLDARAPGGRCRSPPRGWAACWMRWSTRGGCSALIMLPGAMRCSSSWWRRGSSSRSAAGLAAGAGGSRGRAGVDPTVNRRLRVYAKDSWRQQISAACAAHARVGLASLVLFDVSTLYFETDEGDWFREPGFSKERGWNRRSLSACSPALTVSRSWSRRSKGTRPRPGPCSR